jgi:hypothetical protein
MSHLVTIQTQIRDPAALAAACRRLQLPEPELRTAQLFSRSATGRCVQLPGWRHPVVCQTDAGQLHYDNFGGRWGDPRQLHRLLQAYAIEKVKCEARKTGRIATETPLADGSVRIELVASS